MSKYTHEQLTAMAKSYLSQKQNNPPIVSAQFLQIISHLAGISVQEVQNRINMLAEGDFSFETKGNNYGSSRNSFM